MDWDRPWRKVMEDFDERAAGELGSGGIAWNLDDPETRACRSDIRGRIHVHFDLDALDPHEFPYVAYPGGRLGVEEAVDLLGCIARQTGVVGLTETRLRPLR